MTQSASFMSRLAGARPRVPSLQQMSREFSVPMVGARNVNAPAAVRVCGDWQPDLIISVYLNQRVGTRLIRMAQIGVINVHPAYLPRSRGLFPYFWALANGDAETGVTVHWVDARFDTGAILVQEKLPITSDDTVISLAQKSAEMGAELLVRAVRLIERGDPPHMPQDTQRATYHSWPTPMDVRRFTQRGKRYGSLRDMWHELIG